MRKKYLSALLFGALLVTSTGTFTSCKDYDDEINDLQGQITANSEAIKALEQLVKAGKYVSGVAMEGQVITFTFSDGTTQTVTIPEGEKGQVVEVKDNELYIDGEATGIKVAEEAAVEAGLVKAENGTWWVLGEDGEYTNTNIPVSGVTVSGSEADGYTFTIYNEKGEAQTVKLPTAASSITSVSLETPTADNRKFNLAAQEFKFNNNENALINSRSDWKGSKALPNDGDWVLSSKSKFNIRIDPVSADISNVNFYLTNTKNTDLPEITLNAAAEDGNDPLKDTQGRAANIGNGLWTLSMPNTVVADATYGDANSGVCKEIKKVVNGEYLYALNAGHSCRSLYEFTVHAAEAPVLSKVVFTQSGNGSVTTTSLKDQIISEEEWTVKVGVPVKVTGDENSDVYDIYLEVADEDAKYKVTFDQENHTFTIGQNPDWSTRAVQLPVIVWTIDNNGNINKTKVTVTLNSEFSTDVNYEAVTHNIAVSSDKNVKYIDLQKMKDGFQSQDDLDSWIKNVSFTETDYVVYSDEQCETQVTSSKLTIETVEKQDINIAALNGTKGASANYVRIKVDNTEEDNLKLDTKYYVKATYKDIDDNILNSIVIPITFTAPTVAEQFAVSTNYQNGTENSIKAFYNNWEVNIRNINLVTYFKAYDKYATLSLDNDAVITKYNGEDKKSADLATLTNDDIATGYINLNRTMILNDDTNREAGYGQALKVNVVNTNYTDTKWAYSNEADTKYSFTISVFSPIFEGTIAATDGSKNLTVIANSEDGSDITADMVKLTDYANNKYNVVPDDFGNAYNNKYNKEGDQTGKDIWSAKQIENVWVEETGDNNYIKEIKLRGLQEAGENVIPGAITVIAQPVPSYTEPTEVTVNVKDVWGYVTSQPLNITLTPNSEN